jgi:hypothetical protein
MNTLTDDAPERKDARITANLFIQKNNNKKTPYEIEHTGNGDGEGKMLRNSNPSPE